MKTSWWAGTLLMLTPLLSQAADSESGPELPNHRENGPTADETDCAGKNCVAHKTRSGNSLTVPVVAVVGQRASLATARQIRQENLDIVDAVVADEIHKLPDITVGEALQRVPGVQINRDRGESPQISIRGLSQIETLLNGREVFTAGNGRNLDFSDFPSETISDINVYKTSSADHIEGGIGGMVDLRTHRPFDFSGREVVVSGRAIQGDLIDKFKQQFSVLASDRWGEAGNGEFGALVNLVHQERAWREDQETLGAYAARTMAGNSINVPTSILESTSAGTRNRTNGNVVLQWRPTDTLDLYAEGNYTEFRTRQNSYQLFTQNGTKPTTFSGVPSVFSGTQDLQSIDWTNVALSTQDFARDTIDRTTQIAVGGSWTKNALTLKTDFSYTKSFNNLFYLASSLNVTASHLTQNISTSSAPGIGISGTNLLNPANYTYAGVSYAFRPFHGELKAAQLDAEYQQQDSILDMISAGVRYAEREATSQPGQVSGFIPSGASATSDLTARNPYGNFLPGTDGVGDYLTGHVSRDVGTLLSSLGLSASGIASSNPLGTWSVTEKTASGYLMGTLKTDRMEGNVGVRLIRTQEQVLGSTGQVDSGNRLIPGTLLPIRQDTTYTDALPSLNLRFPLGPSLYLKTAASKSLTRPDFNQMSPSLTLNPVTGIGSAGNPLLGPVRSNNFDIAMEQYFGSSTSVYLTVFSKKVDGFIATTTANEVWGGKTYQVTRPYNSASADIDGAEIGYQQFYDFLPGWLSGLGLQFNYTYLDSRAFNKLLGKDMQLQNISRNNWNLIGMYEKGPVSIRVGYNWRDKYLMDVNALSGIGATPLYMKAYGWLDAAMSYRLSKQITLGLEGMNLLRTQRQSYYGTETRPKDSFLNDRQISAVITLQL